MLLFKSIVDETLDLPDVPYDVRDVSRCHSCIAAAEYEDAAFHRMLWGCGEDGEVVVVKRVQTLVFVKSLSNECKRC